MPSSRMLLYRRNTNNFGIWIQILFVAFCKGVIPEVTDDCGDDDSKLHYQKLARAAAEHDHVYIARSLGIICELSEDMVQRLTSVENDIIVDDVKRRSSSNHSTTLSGYYTRWNAFLVWYILYIFLSDVPTFKNAFVFYIIGCIRHCP